jgi:integrase
MAKRRGNHEGSIYQRDNGTWRAQVSLDGERLSFTADTRRECHQWIRKTLGHIDAGMTFDSTKVTLEEFMDDWLSTARISLRKTTWTHYNQVTHQYVIPSIGKVKIRELRPHIIQRLYNHLLDQEVGTWTVIKIHTVLHSALAYAVDTGLIPRNPVAATIPPKEPAKEMRILDESQVSQMLLAAKGSRFEALLQLAVTTGMRQMEILGLTWSDLDWVNQILKVERQLVRSRGKGISFAPPKTKFGRRTLDLGSKTIDVIRIHYQRQHEERQSAGEKWRDHDLIFTNRYGGPLHHRNLLRDFKIILGEAGLPEIRFHDLRHTAASLMLNHGIPLIVVSRRLGHARPSITLDVYGHLIPSMQAEAAQKIDELVTPVELHPIAPEFVSTLDSP